ncbi:hypothetical protein CEXT_124001 [Caerostris extrusa]|uniref:Uncharacterized protein n=1 Tax=Caerostris extrusa TaxID=172846 RepID=A0AAV4RAI4_CAEEX|nr:hypothetical protein CEXT_124001 [Caerostris extrusa]
MCRVHGTLPSVCEFQNECPRTDECDRLKCVCSAWSPSIPFLPNGGKVIRFRILRLHLFVGIENQKGIFCISKGKALLEKEFQTYQDL